MFGSLNEEAGMDQAVGLGLVIHPGWNAPGAEDVDLPGSTDVFALE